MSTLKESLQKAKQSLLVAWHEAMTKEPESELRKKLAAMLEDMDAAIALADEHAEVKQQTEEEWKAELDNLIRTDRSVNKISAIKFYRSKMGCDLREAMYAVQRRMTELRVTA